jgi:predicted nuclease of predicted toxin-antitoxin system
MNVVADESVDRPFIDALRAAGHDVHAIVETNAGSADEDVLSVAYRENWLLITLDKDFGELVFRLRQKHAGILLLRFPPIEHEPLCRILVECLDNHEAQLVNAFCVLTPDTLRINKLVSGT